MAACILCYFRTVAEILKVKHFALSDPVPKPRGLTSFCDFFCNVFSILTERVEFYFSLSCVRLCSCS